jgi:hypothetical protein
LEWACGCGNIWVGDKEQSGVEQALHADVQASERCSVPSSRAQNVDQVVARRGGGGGVTVGS